MPDESANVAYFGKSTNQRGEVGFPIARLVAVFCLATGALIEMVVSPYVGKRTGELSLFRQLLSTFMRGDILLADQQFCTYCDIARLRANGVDVVMRMREDRKRDFRKGKRLGRQDHVVNWTRPDVCPDWLTPKELLNSTTQRVLSLLSYNYLSSNDWQDRDAIIERATTHLVGDRPDRIEPRKRKRRPKSYPLLIRSRAFEKQALLT